MTKCFWTEVCVWKLQSTFNVCECVLIMCSCLFPCGVSVHSVKKFVILRTLRSLVSQGEKNQSGFCFVLAFYEQNKTTQHNWFLCLLWTARRISHVNIFEKNHKSTCLRLCLVTQGRLQSLPLGNTLSWEVITSAAFSACRLPVLTHRRAESQAPLPPPHPTSQSEGLLYLPVSWSCYSQGGVWVCFCRECVFPLFST